MMQILPMEFYLCDRKKTRMPSKKKCDILIDAGEGVGRVTKLGLTQKIGEARD